MPSRRDFIKHLTAVAGLGAVTSLGLGISPARAQAALRGGAWRMPDENGVHACSYVSFGAQAAIWEDFTADVQDCIGLIARTIATYEPVVVLHRPGQLSLARQKCGTRNTRFVEMPLDDVWMRDIGGAFVVDGQGGLGLVDFNFNGWGNKQQHSKDGEVAGEVSYDADASYIASQLTGEGGGIEVDGAGTGIMTESCWINGNRNPGMSKAQVEAELMSNLGLRRIIWLPGIKGKDITDAHVDFYARFARPGVVVANLEEDPDSHDYDVTRAHLEILRSATDADGNRLQLHTLSPPRRPRAGVYQEDNDDFAAGYINYFVINGAVIAPEFGDARADGKARDLLRALYPGRDVLQLDIDAIASGGGGIHCVTHQLPAV